MSISTVAALRDMRRLARKLLHGYAGGACPCCNVPIDDHGDARIDECARAVCGFTASEIVARCEARRARRAA